MGAEQQGDGLPLATGEIGHRLDQGGILGEAQGCPDVTKRGRGCTVRLDAMVERLPPLLEIGLLPSAPGTRQRSNCIWQRLWH